jgi:hypothetical protein
VKYRFVFEFQQDNNLQGQTSKVLVATLFIISSIVLSLNLVKSHKVASLRLYDFDFMTKLKHS